MKTTQRIFSLMIVVFVVAMFVIPQTALAYIHKATATGAKVRWQSNQVHFVIDESVSSIAPIDQMENLISEVFDEWVDIARLPIEFSFKVGKCSNFGYNPKGTNENCILAGETTSSDHAMATTRMTYSPSTGRIRDADILISDKSEKWTLGDDDSRLSLRAALLHEVGHVLGLSHSEIDEAIMAPRITTGTRGILYNDDIEGAVNLYEDLDLDDNSMMCSVVTIGGHNQNSQFFFLLFATLALLWIVARRSGLVRS